MFDEFSRELYEAFQHPLPGKPAQDRLKPYLKLSPGLDAPQLPKPKIGAVMSLIYPVHDIPHLLFIERPVYDGVHSGQIAFPGGKVEKEDTSSLDAALRETQEEVGIAPSEIRVLGPLTEVYVLASNFLVYPYVGLLNNIPHITPEKNEVAATLEVPIHRLLEENSIKEKPIRNALGFTLQAPYYDLDGKVLWGATAMMVSELCAIIRTRKIRVGV